MWVNDHEGALVNLAFAEQIYISTKGEHSYVHARLQSGDYPILYVGPNKKDCEHYLKKLAIRLVVHV